MPKKLTYEYVKKYVENYNYKLLSTEYKNNSTKLDMMCHNNHKCSISFGHFKNGRRCNECAKESKSKAFRLNYEEVKNYIENEGYKLLSTEYKNNRTPLNLICPNGHTINMRFDNFRGGNRCKICSCNEQHDKQKLTYEEVKNYIESFGYKLLSTEYIRAKEYLTIQCTENHVYDVRFYNFKTGYRCPICNESKGEKKIKNVLNNLNLQYIYNKPYFNNLLSSKGNPLRPDFIIPDMNIWIEYDGEFHYENKYEGDGHKEIIINDKIKNQYAKDNNWKLIRIPYWEFNNIENILNELLKI